MSEILFDNGDFFENYKNIRTKKDSYNNLLEQPAIKKLLPSLTGKTVLDAGCGFGFSCVEFRNKGASKVVGIDISEKMVKAASDNNEDKNLLFLKFDIDKIDELGMEFDLVYSSMTMHYLPDFTKVVGKVHNVLSKGGIFLFSQEHPLLTAPTAGVQWLKDENGVKTSAVISNYLQNGVRNVRWMDQDVTKQHRSLSTIINTLIDNSFSILNIIEPAPTEEVLKTAPHMYDELLRPTAIIIKAQKIVSEQV